MIVFRSLFLASAVAYEKVDTRVYLYHGRSAHRKTLHSVPHDLGDPGKSSYLISSSMFVVNMIIHSRRRTLGTSQCL